MGGSDDAKRTSNALHAFVRVCSCVEKENQPARAKRKGMRKRRYMKKGGRQPALHEGSPNEQVEAEDGCQEVDHLKRRSLGAEVVLLEVLTGPV